MRGSIVSGSHILPAGGEERKLYSPEGSHQQAGVGLSQGGDASSRETPFLRQNLEAGLALPPSQEVTGTLIGIQFKPPWDSLCPCECQPVFISQSTNIY